MSDDLDDFEIQHPRDPQDEIETVRRPMVPRRRPRLALLFAALGIVALGAAGAFWMLSRPAPSAPAPPVAAPSPTAQASLPAMTPGPLPPLADSDPFIRGLAAALSAHPELARWLGQTALVRTLTAVVSSIARGETPRPDLEFLAPTQRFRAAAGGTDRIVADPASYASYDRFGDAIASIDAAAAADAYRATEPLFDVAHRELGYPEPFRPTLETAIRELLAVPVPPANAELLPHAAGFRWADPALEGLTSAQKQLLRTGPRNVRRVQDKLRELRAALERAGDAPPAAP